MYATAHYEGDRIAYEHTVYAIFDDGTERAFKSDDLDSSPAFFGYWVKAMVTMSEDSYTLGDQSAAWAATHPGLRRWLKDTLGSNEKAARRFIDVFTRSHRGQDRQDGGRLAGRGCSGRPHQGRLCRRRWTRSRQDPEDQPALSKPCCRYRMTRFLSWWFSRSRRGAGREYWFKPWPAVRLGGLPHHHGCHATGIGSVLCELLDRASCSTYAALDHNLFYANPDAEGPAAAVRVRLSP